MQNRSDIIVAASLLSSDFCTIGTSIAAINKSGADWIHFDVMDGSFVPQITFGHKMLADSRNRSKLPFDVHLMVNNPEKHIDDFVKAGADHITIHYEAAIHLNGIISRIKSYGKKAGISLVPSTPVQHIIELLPFVDLVLVMTVNPGFGGQTMINECLKKAEFLNELRVKKGYNYLIEADGGINLETVKSARTSGFDVLITGSAFFKSDDPSQYVALCKQNYE
jgi:ribulose-phosphate 3-epimerase